MGIQEDTLDRLQRSLGGIGQAGLQNYITVDKRTKRQRLEDKRAENSAKIVRLHEENVEITETLKLLDESPVLERLDNLTHKLLG